MPLKQAVIPVLNEVDRVATVTGAANTVLFDDSETLAESQHSTHERRRPTRVAAADDDARRHLRRDPWLQHRRRRHRACARRSRTHQCPLRPDPRRRCDRGIGDGRRRRARCREGRRRGAVARAQRLAGATRALARPDDPDSFARSGRPHTRRARSGREHIARLRCDRHPLHRLRHVDAPTLLDVSYDPWPSTFARAWESVGGAVVSGLAMLAHQALLQVRIFAGGDPLQPLDKEDDVLAAMLAAVGIDATGKRSLTRAITTRRRRRSSLPLAPSHRNPLIIGYARIDNMLRWLTAGESHGPELIAILEGLPAGVPVTLDESGPISPAASSATAAARE